MAATLTNLGTRNTAGTTLLGLFAIPVGVAGVGGVWQTGRTTLGAPAWPAEIMFGTSTVLWAAFTVTYAVGGLRRAGTFSANRKDAIYGPFAAYIPIVGILLAAHYVQHARTAARAAVVVFVLALALISAQLLAHWLLGNLLTATLPPAITCQQSQALSSPALGSAPRAGMEPRRARSVSACSSGSASAR